MEVPGNWESRGLPDFDGVVWFTRSFDLDRRGADDAVPRAAPQQWRSVDQRSVADARPFVPGAAVAAQRLRGGGPWERLADLCGS